MFKDAETLVDDFFDEGERALRERGVDLPVTREEESGSADAGKPSFNSVEAVGSVDSRRLRPSIHALNTFITRSPRWSITFTAEEALADW